MKPLMHGRPPQRSRVSTMTAVVIEQPGVARMVQVPRPEPGAGMVRVRVAGCGVCGSNVPLWTGRPWFEYPLSPGEGGHEAWGWVDALGDGVTGLACGEAVAFLSHRSFAEFDVVDAGAVAKLPEGWSGEAFPGEPMGCAVNIVRRSAIVPGQTVVVVGVGYLGAMLTRLASAAGANVLAISRRSTSLEAALRMGARSAHRLADTSAMIEATQRFNSGRLAPRVIECTGTEHGLQLAGELCDTRGRLIIAGYHQDGPRMVNMQMWNWRGLDVINAHERDPQVYMKGLRQAISAVSDGRLDPRPLHTHVFSLQQFSLAMDTAAKRPEGFMKALIRMDSGQEEGRSCASS